MRTACSAAPGLSPGPTGGGNGRARPPKRSFKPGPGPHGAVLPLRGPDHPRLRLRLGHHLTQVVPAAAGHGHPRPVGASGAAPEQPTSRPTRSGSNRRPKGKPRPFRTKAFFDECGAYGHCRAGRPKGVCRRDEERHAAKYSNTPIPIRWPDRMISPIRGDFTGFRVQVPPRTPRVVVHHPFQSTA